jgi:hypothetical protein
MRKRKYDDVISTNTNAQAQIQKHIINTKFQLLIQKQQLKEALEYGQSISGDLDCSRLFIESKCSVIAMVRIAHAYGFLSQNAVLCVGTARCACNASKLATV